MDNNNGAEDFLKFMGLSFLVIIFAAICICCWCCRVKLYYKTTNRNMFQSEFSQNISNLPPKRNIFKITIHIDDAPPTYEEATKVIKGK